jgi:tRNA (cytidine/uridine-2'-O-)-methyltransferase
MRIALYQPDIAANVGTIIRLGSCMGIPVDIIEPCGFPFGDASLRRAGLDYLPKATVIRHTSWQEFSDSKTTRVVLATTKSALAYYDFKFDETDTLLLGSETSGVPQQVAETCNAAVRIPMRQGMRSLNVAVAAGMIVGEMLRQTRALPGGNPNEH